MADNAMGAHIGSLHEAISQIEAPGVCSEGCLASPVCLRFQDIQDHCYGNVAKVIMSIKLPLAGVYLAGANDSAAAIPALVVQGLGHLSVPITPEQSSQLKALCSPDPGYLKDATSDPEMCPAWQLGPSQFLCSNPGQTSGQTAG